MNATTTAVTRIAGRDEVLRSAVMPVVVKVIHAKRVGVSWVHPIPSHRTPAPVTQMRPWADGVVQDHPMNVSASVGHGDRVARKFPDAIALRVQRALCCLIQGAGSRETPAVHLAQAVSVVRAITPLDLASVPIPPPMNIAVVLQAPVVHLTKPLTLVRLAASFNRAKRVSLWSLKRAEWVTVPKEAKAVGLAVAVGVMSRMTVLDRALSHGSILAHLRARIPSFYGSTYCCRCRLHRPVGPEGEFTWVNGQGDDTHVLVGT
jgi:hypothetical protein